MKRVKVLLIACALVTCVAGCGTTTQDGGTSTNPNMRTNYGTDGISANKVTEKVREGYDDISNTIVNDVNKVTDNSKLNDNKGIFPNAKDDLGMRNQDRTGNGVLGIGSLPTPMATMMPTPIP